MANVNDYLKWRGDIPISRDFPFNELDGVVLARLSYLLFDKIKLDKEETILSIYQKMIKLSPSSFIREEDYDLIRNLGQSRRFKDMLVTDYEQDNDKDLEKQFRAITIHLSSKEMFISFMGTDATITGVKEDLNMSFLDNVPCQEKGLEYLKECAYHYPYKKIRLGGHSKGGNVAIYALLRASKDIQRRIIKVYNYDGPGFTNNILRKYAKDKIINKIETFIPQDSIIGRMLNHQEKMTIIYSDDTLASQHNVYLWQVQTDHFIKLDHLRDVSDNIDMTLSTWLEETTPYQRQVLADTIFELFKATGEDKFRDISHNLTSNIPKILKKYTEISPEDKKVMTRLIKKLVSVNAKVMKEKETLKWHQMKDTYLEKGKLKMHELNDKYLHNRN